MTAEEFVKFLGETGDEAYTKANLGSNETDHEQLFIYRCCQIAIGSMEGFQKALEEIEKI